MVRTFQLTKALARLSVLENMCSAPRASAARGSCGPCVPGMWRAQEKANTETADDLLARFKLDAKRDEFAGSLSGGQRKLLEMARALMSDPQVVMLDEPMAGVNPALTQSLLGHVKDLRDQGMTVIFVEHDMDVVHDISDWVVVMAEGRVIAEGPPESIGPNQAVVDAYLGAHHDAPLTVEEEDRVLAEASGDRRGGEPPRRRRHQLGRRSRRRPTDERPAVRGRRDRRGPHPRRRGRAPRPSSPPPRRPRPARSTSASPRAPSSGPTTSWPATCRA